MKILFDHPNPFSLAHGGFQIQIEQTKSALEKLGMEVEFLRWWDDRQRGDVIHFFGRPNDSYIRFAHTKGTKVVMSELLTSAGSRSATELFVQKLMIQFTKRMTPSSFTNRFAWDSYQLADAVIALTAWEASLMQKLFAAPTDNVHIIPNGVENIFFRDPAAGHEKKNDWLVCSASITQRKCSLELAKAAIIAQVPVWFIGSPYTDNAPYYQEFLILHQQHPDFVKYEGAVNDREKLAAIYQAARGFVLLSTMESLSLSALEAAAAGCPLLLSDLPWARYTFKEQAYYCPLSSPSKTAPYLKKFYRQTSPILPPPPLTWHQVTEQLLGVYRSLSA